GISRLGGRRGESRNIIPRLDDNRSNESIAAARSSLNPTVSTWGLAEDLPQGCDLYGKVTVIDYLTGPRRFNQRILQNQCARLFDQCSQHGDRPTAKRYRLPSAEEQVALRVQPKWPQRVNGHRWRNLVTFAIFWKFFRFDSRLTTEEGTCCRQLQHALDPA